MKPINYYTTLSDHTETRLQRLDRDGKLFVIFMVLHNLIDNPELASVQLSTKAFEEIKHLSLNESLGLIKGLADQCQETLISK